MTGPVAFVTLRNQYLSTYYDFFPNSKEKHYQDILYCHLTVLCTYLEFSETGGLLKPSKPFLSRLAYFTYITDDRNQRRHDAYSQASLPYHLREVLEMLLYFPSLCFQFFQVFPSFSSFSKFFESCLSSQSTSSSNNLTSFSGGKFQTKSSS